MDDFALRTSRSIVSTTLSLNRKSSPLPSNVAWSHEIPKSAAPTGKTLTFTRKRSTDIIAWLQIEDACEKSCMNDQREQDFPEYQSGSFKKYEEVERQKREHANSLLQKHSAAIDQLIASIHDDGKFDQLHAALTLDLIAGLEGFVSPQILQAYRGERADPFKILGGSGAKELGLNLQFKHPQEADYAHLRRYYVYIHRDMHGKAFYVGKGKKTRAWDKERYEVWRRYVERYLNGRYSIEIAYDNLSELAALTMETAVMSCFDFKKLANCDNPFIDPEPWYSEERWRRDAPGRHWSKICGCVRQAEKIEKSQPESALTIYLDALTELDAWAQWAIDKEDPGDVRSLVSRDMLIEKRHGNLRIIDRLTSCLALMGRYAEAAAYADKYFAKYRFDAELREGIEIQRRVAALVGRQPPDPVPPRSSSTKTTDRQLRLFDTI